MLALIHLDSGKPLTGSSANDATKGSQNNTYNEFQDSAASNYSARVSAKVSSQKTPAVILSFSHYQTVYNLYVNICHVFNRDYCFQEEASVRRRQQAARQALVGKTPGTYTQLFQR